MEVIAILIPRRVTAVLAATVLTALTLAGCARSTAGAGQVSVVASFYPLAEVASEIGGGRVHVTNLTPAGTEPHDLELTTDQVDAVLDADLVLYLGQGFQPAVQDAVRRSRARALDLLQGLPVVERPGDGTGLDPHVWLDPELLIEITRRVERTLAQIDPGDAGSYAAAAADYEDRLGNLDTSFREGLSGCAGRVLVTTHAAFGYLASRYSLRQVAIAGLAPEAEPDPRRLADIADLIRRAGVTTIFTETLVAPDIAETLARETGAHTALLDPIEGLTRDQEAAGATYISLMNDNLVTLREGLGCP